MTPDPACSAEASADDSFLELLIDTLASLDEPTRGQFLQNFFRTIAQQDLTETQSLEYWTRILDRRRELIEKLGRRASLKAAIIEILASANLLRVPVMMEYDDFKQLQINAASDPLTGLYNRRLFDEYFEKELNRAQRYNQHIAVVILDLRKLKQVNDRHGHLQGDHVLQLAAATLRKTIRASDFAFRIGGDEFALLLPQTDPEQANTLCRRIRAQYESEVQALNVGVGVTLDFGVAVHPEDGAQKRELMSLADERLYELKDGSHAHAAQTRVIPMEPKPEPEPSAPPAKPADPPKVAVIPQAAPKRSPQAEQRKWERVSLSGTKAYALISDVGSKNAKVIDLSYGGVALQCDKPEDLPNQFNAVLHVPILPPVRVILRKAYTIAGDAQPSRVGCTFVS